jgi:hypothetical protein
MLCTPHQILYKKTEIDRACSMYGGEEGCMQYLSGET